MKKVAKIIVLGFITTCFTITVGLTYLMLDENTNYDVSFETDFTLMNDDLGFQKETVTLDVPIIFEQQKNGISNQQLLVVPVEFAVK